MRHISNFIIITVSVLITWYFLESAKNIFTIPEEYIQLLIEISLAFISLSIFALTWYSYSKSKDNHSLFLGATFLIIGILSFLEAFSYPFMPDLISANSLEKATIFWSEARITFALLFLASAYVYRDTLPELMNKPVLFAFAITACALFVITGLFYPVILSPLYSIPEIIITEIVCAAVILYSTYVYSVRIKKTDQKNLIFLIYTSIIVVISIPVHFIYRLPEYLFLLAGFYFAHLALYRSSLELPYEKLAIAEEKLRHAAEERYRNLFNNALDAIITCDLEDKITSWNKSAQTIFGWTEKEAVGTDFLQLLMPPEMLDTMKKILKDVIAGRVVSDIDVVCTHKNRANIYVSITVSPLRDLNQKTIGTSGILRDITERKKIGEIRRENEHLILASKAKSEFLAIMSHELRTPLNSIIGFSELLKQNVHGDLNNKQEHYVCNVLSSSRLLLNLIDGILDISKVEAGRMELYIEKMKVSQSINETLDMLMEKASRQNVIFKKEFDPDLEFIDADKQKFKQILFNLVNNAVKFSKPEGGTVTITAKKEGEIAKFLVSDNGIGIRKEDIGRLFKTFEQLESGISRKYGGTGLGLAISKKLVELHGGEIRADSKYGEGTTFTFFLPISIKT